MIKWWAYVHVNGTFHVKRFFSYDDIAEANESSFVAQVYGPIEADSREKAVEVFESMIK